MEDQQIYHPIQGTLDVIWNAGHTPRLQVDATHSGVVVPDSVKEEWGKKLVIDLDATWPLNLEFTEVGILADLAFHGYIQRCVFPWNAIYVVLDRATGKGIAIESHIPKEEPGEEPGDEPVDKPVDDAAQRRAKFRVIPGNKP